MRQIGTALMLLATLAGCEGKGDDRICGSLAMALPPGLLAADNRLQVATACVERWGARLSFSKDSARDIADAAIGACDDAIDYLEADQAKQDERPQDIEAARTRWRRKAMFRAIQWRAGECPLSRAA